VPETAVHLVRHGQVENPGRVLYGRLPGFVLSARGQAQAARLADHFADAPLAAVVASPLERATQTATPIAAAHGLEVGIDLRLTEASNVFEGVAGNLAWYILRHPRIWWQLRDLRGPSWGERNVDTVERVHAAVAEARDEFAGGQAVLVSHQAPIWVARLAFERRSLAHLPTRRRCALASVTTLTFDGEQLQGVRYAEPAAAALLGLEPGSERAGA
jgi:broad specificity phosphatase PhoE